MTAWSFVGQLLLTVLALGVAVYLPGRLWLRLLKVELDPLEYLAGALVCGMAWMALLYWVLSWLGVGYLLGVYALAAGGYELYRILRQHIYLKHMPGYLPEQHAQREFWRAHWPLGLFVLAAWQARRCSWSGAGGTRPRA